MHVKSKITTIVLLFVLLNINKAESQITIYDVLGDYICNVNHLATFTGPLVSTCTGTKLRFVYATPSLCNNNDFAALDSGCCTTYFVNVFGQHIVINADSSFQSCGGSPGYPVGGKYFPNDSIYLKLKVGSDPDFYEYFGKKIQGTGIKENKLKNNWAEVYPCPALNYVNVNFPIFTGTVQYCIYDLQNRLIKEGIFTQPENQLSVAEIPPGMYILKLTGKEFLVTKKFIIQE